MKDLNNWLSACSLLLLRKGRIPTDRSSANLDICQIVIFKIDQEQQSWNSFGFSSASLEECGLRLFNRSSICSLSSAVLCSSYLILFWWLSWNIRISWGNDKHHLIKPRISYFLIFSYAIFLPLIDEKLQVAGNHRYLHLNSASISHFDCSNISKNFPKWHRIYIRKILRCYFCRFDERG